MSKPRLSLPDHLDAVNAHLTNVSARLKADDLSGTQLHEFVDLLTVLAEAVHLYADKLNGSPAVSGRHALKGSPDNAPPAS